MVVYLKDKYYDSYILCAIDKDVLYQTEGTHWNYGKDEAITVSKDDAIKFAYYQTLAGDVTDGYKGCPGIGDKKATKALEGLTNEVDMWNKTIELYESKGLTIDDAINTMRLANMKQYNGKEIVLWTPPSTL